MTREEARDQIYNEVRAIEFICSYVPAQILFNIKDKNYTLEEFRNMCSRNKNILNCIDLLLDMCHLYEKSYNILGASNYLDLNRSNLQHEYNSLLRTFNSTLKKAKDSTMAFCIKNYDYMYTDVYQLLLNKRDALYKKLCKQGGSNTQKWQLEDYDMMIAEYNRVNYSKSPLFHC